MKKETGVRGQSEEGDRSQGTGVSEEGDRVKKETGVRGQGSVKKGTE